MPQAPSPTALEQPAAIAVLKTNELLTQILFKVPRKYRVNLRRVSKTWRHVVSKIGFAVEPVYLPPRRAHERLYAYDTLYYPAHLTFKCNPAVIRGSNTTVSHRRRFCNFNVADYNSKSKGTSVLKGADEFITDPPITQVAIAALGNTGYIYIRVVRGAGMAVLRVAKGIQVTHLHETLRKMSSSAWEQSAGCHDPVPTLKNLRAQFALSKRVVLPSGRLKYFHRYMSDFRYWAVNEPCSDSENEWTDDDASDTDGSSDAREEEIEAAERAKIEWSQELYH